MLRILVLRLQLLVEQFHQAHYRRYTYDLRQSPVELVNLRVSATGPLPKHPMPRVPLSSEAPAPIEWRPVYFGPELGQVQTPCYSREALGTGTRITGPPIIQQRDTTTVIVPGQEAQVDWE